METTLRGFLGAIGEPLVDVVVAPAGLDVALTGLAIVDPDDEPDRTPGGLVLVIGVRGRAAAGIVAAVARGGAAAVAVKGGGPIEALRTAAAEGGVALLIVRPDVRWERLESLARDVLQDGDTDEDSPGDLNSLAQTVALLTGGVVSIEDASSRVLAYSRSDRDDAQVDELRRRSILGRQGPEEYLRMLREWGVFDRLRAGEEVVPVEEHPELGIRRRLAIGIHAGQRHLGTIWVQEGAGPFTERAAEVLVGAARVAAGHLVHRRSRQSPAWGQDLLAGLLDGRASPDLVAGSLGLDEHAGAVVVGFAVQVTGTGASHELTLAELAELVAVHAVAHRRAAMCTAIGARVYALLPDVSRTDAALTAMCAEVVAAAQRRSGGRVQAGIGTPVDDLAGAPDSRREADRVLDVMAQDQPVAVFGEIRAEVLLNQALDLLTVSPDLRDPGIARLVEYDREHRTDLVASVLAWLDAMGDVRAAAQVLTVHPNTLRYRVRRAAAIAGLRLNDPRARLVHHLQLLAAHRES